MSSPLIQSVSSLPLFQQYTRPLSDSFGSSQANIDPIQEVLSDRNPLTIRTSIFNTAVVYSLRDWPAWGLESSFTALSNSSTQPLLIHGTTDNTVPYKYTSKILTFLSHSHLLTVDGAGHDIIVTYTTQVSVVLVQSLSMKGHMNGAANTYLYNISLPPDDGWTPVPPYP